MRIYLVLLFTLVGISGINAQSTKEEQEKPFIEVNGVAEREIIPDEIYISIVLRERHVSKEKVSIEQQEEKLKACLKDIGIGLDNLFLSDANADYVKVRFKTKDVITQKNYTLRVSSASQLGQAFEQLGKLEITDAYVERVWHSKMDSLKKAMRIGAIKAAKEKADYLLSAIGEQTGKALIVREDETEDLKRRRFRTESAHLNTLYRGGEAEENDEIQFSKVRVRSSIYVKFAIK